MRDRRSAKSFGETRAEVDKYPVIPAQAQREPESSPLWRQRLPNPAKTSWIPAFAGMTHMARDRTVMRHFRAKRSASRNPVPVLAANDFRNPAVADVANPAFSYFVLNQKPSEQ